MTAVNNEQPSQEYELKLGVIHDPALKTVQLIQFLENQANQFLRNDLPQYVKGDQKFLNVMESITHDSPQLSQYEFEEYVGLLLIYSTSSDQSYQYYLKNIQTILSMDVGDLFIISIEMDNSDKQANVIGNSGQKFCKKNGLQFVRLSLYNSQDLITLINKNLYELIENYYYPNEQPQPQSKQQLILQTPIQQPLFSNPLTDRSKKSNRQIVDQNSQYIFSYDDNNRIVKAFTESSPPPSGKAEQILSHAESLRKSRQRQISIEQQQIDESIQNIQNVLNNINHRIKQKLQSGWFTSIKHKLYMTAQKDNQNFSKIKLTQQFIDDSSQNKHKKNTFSSIVQSRYSDSLYQSSKTYALNFNSLKFTTTQLRTPILKMILFSSRDKVVELQIYENSTYDELALIALKRLGIKQTDKNIEKMVHKVRRRIENFSKQFQRAIKVNEEKRIHERSFLKSKANEQSIQRKV